MIVVEVLAGVLGLGVVWVQPGVRGPGLTRITPIRDRLRKVSMQIVTLPVPAQDGITRDNVTVRVDAVVYFRVDEPVTAIVNVQDYLFAVEQVAQTSLRSIIGKSDLDDLLSNRESLNKGLELMIDSPALGWGIHIERVEIKDVALPEAMKRSMSRQAEAERERRARIITADGEYQASQKLSQAAQIMSHTPAALQLRLLETVVQVSAEKNSTLVLPFPVELLRFLERATPADPPAAESAAAEPAAADRAAVDPAAVDRAAVDRAAVDPAAVDRAAADRAAVDPAAVGRAAVDPTAVDLTAVDRAAVDPAAVEPAAAEPPADASLPARRPDQPSP
jgi:regulator of protease activity HflC (stomatin/prohibitin superfamily)